MALRKETYSKIPGLRLKRRCGDKVTITHEKSGDEIIVQVIAFWDGYQVTLAFSGDEFQVERDDRELD